MSPKDVQRVDGPAALQVRDLADQGLTRFNELHAGPRDPRTLVLAVRDAHGELIGGLAGQSSWNALQIELLWVAESHRSQGYGRQLVLEAEQEARRLALDVVYLSTLSFQAPGFYERLGYRQIGTLDDVPEGARRIWFCKDIGPARA